MTQLPPTEAHRVVVQRQAERRRRSEIQQLVDEASHEAAGTTASDLVSRLLGRPAHVHPVRVPVRAEPAFALEPES
jgi:hypothetical protein